MKQPQTFHVDDVHLAAMRSVIEQLYDGTTMTYDRRRQLAAILDSIVSDADPGGITRRKRPTIVS